MSFGLLGTIFITAAAATMLYVRLLQGGLSLDWLRPSIERALDEDLGGSRVQIDAAELRLEDGGLVIHLKQTSVRDPQGQVLAQTSNARAVMSSSALRRGRLAVKSLDLVAPRLMITATAAGGLAMSFEPPTAPLTTPPTSPTPPRAPVAPSTTPQTSTAPTTSGVADAAPVDLIKLFIDASARARRRETSTGFLREVGVRDAVVIVSSGTHRTVWNVPEARLDMTHGSETSAVKARATVTTLTGPLTVEAVTSGTSMSDQLAVDVTATGFNPRGLARLVPGFGAIETIDLPIVCSAKLLISSDGALRSATVEANGADGAMRFGLLGRKPVTIDAARIALAYDGARRAIDLSDLTIGWAGNRLGLTGQIVDTQTGGWNYALRSSGGVLASPRADAKGTAIDQVRATGRLQPSTGRFTLEDFALKVARAEVTAKGDIVWNDGVPGGQIDGRLSPMGVEGLIALWPSLAAPGVRNWVGSHVTKGQLAGGLFRAAIDGTGGETNARLSLTLEASNVEVKLANNLPPIEVPRGLFRAEGQTIEITAPEFLVTASEGRKLSFKTARFTAVETAAGDQPTAEVAFRLSGSLAAAADIADRDGLQLLRSNGISIPGLDGKLDGQFKATFPLADNVQMTEVRSEGRVRITDLRARHAVGPHDVSGGSVDIDIGDKVVDVKGNILVKGVNGRVGWQYLTNQPLAQQPPLRVAVNLDNADRNALGLDVADLVQGETPVEVLVSFQDSAPAQTRVRVDLTKAELTFEPLFWKKTVGRPATLFFDPVKGPGAGTAQRLELQNMKLTGEDIALDGWMAIGPDNKPREFSFPEFTLNFVSRLAVHGKRRPDNVLEITAKGATFDGRNLFRGMFNIGKPNQTVKKDKPGLDLTAEIDTVIGFSDTSLKAVKLRASERAEKLTTLDLSATLAAGKSLTAVVLAEPGIGRQLRAQSNDAGQVFKVVGFYPSAVGGNMKLQVNLDAQGVNEKSGVLWAENFSVLGDSIVGDLYQNADSQPSSGQGPNQPKRNQAPRVARQQFDFEQLYIPFAVGAGQFVIPGTPTAAIIRGPVIGASFRGKIDFNQQHVNLGGNYVPLSGLNQALGSILGPLTGGAQGDGLFGITFQVVGPLANPQVIANPLSLLTPGIFREIMQLTPETFKVTPRADTPSVGNATRTRGRMPDPSRASSAPAAATHKGTTPQAAPPRTKGEIVPGWTSDVKPSAQ